MTKIKNQISAFVNSAFPPDRFPFPKRVGKAKPKPKDEVLRNRVDAKFAEFDFKGAIRELSSDVSLAPDNSQTLDQLKEKHPAAPVGVSLPPAPEDDEAHIQVSSDSVKKAILSFPAGCAGGPDGLKPGHLKHLIGTAGVGNRLLDALTKLVNLILKDKIPEVIRPIFFGANLFALEKKDGGVRPIAVGSTLRRLTTKVGLNLVSRNLANHFEPSQLGYSSRGGSEAAAHAARLYLKSDIRNKVLLKLDIKNAFNCMRRDTILLKVKEKIPSLYNLFWQAYSGPSHLFYRDTTIPSQTGLQQGDPGGPALFSLGLDDIVKGLKSELNIWFLDDSNLADSPEVVLEDLVVLKEKLDEIGLSINASKSELICLNVDNHNEVITKFKRILPDLDVTPIKKAIILGSPIASQGVRTVLNQKLDALKRMISRLNLIDPHQAFVLLKHSFAIPKLIHLLRASPAYQQEVILQEYDSTVRDAMSFIMNVDFSENAWTQASLPVRSGGLGIRKAVDIALPCYISSSISAQPLVAAITSSVTGLAPFEVTNEIEKWKAEGFTEPEGEFRKRQKAWDLPRIDFLQKFLLGEAKHQYARARLLASAQPESGAWITAIPVPNLGTQLTPEELRIAIALRTGSKICERHRCKCGGNADEFGYHLLSCHFNEGRLPRHTAINNIICRALKASDTPATLEPLGLNRENGLRPDGVTINPFSRGKPLSWDATCVNTFAESSIYGNAIEAGHAAAKAEAAKRVKYGFMANSYRFEPIAIGTLGAYGPTTKNIIREIGKLTTDKTGETRETQWLKQRLSIAVQRGNALSILSRTRHLTDFA